MPELPEVETVRRGLEPWLEGRRLDSVVLRRDSLRVPLPPDFVQAVQGQRVTAVGRRAKYLTVALSNERIVLAHLGMSGRMTVHRPGEPLPPLGAHDHAIFRTDEGAEIRFNDARRFGLLVLSDTDGIASHPLLKDIGPEPLEAGFDGPYLAAKCAGRATAIKLLLLDQKLVAGIGNIYACEALFAAGIAPQRPGRSLDGAEAARLAQAVKDVLAKAIAAGGSSLRDYVQADGELGYFQHQWAVYGREGQPCSRCAGTVQRIAQGGRSTFFCPDCQR